MNTIPFRFVGILLLPAAMAAGAEPVRIRACTVEGRVVTGVVQDWRLDGFLEIRTSAEVVERIETANLDRLEVVNPAVEAPTGAWMVESWDGARLAVDLRDGDARRLVLHHAQVGSLSLPIERLKRLRRRSATVSDPPAGGETDVVVLANGDRLTGAMISAGPDALTLAIGDHERSVAWDVVQGVWMATPSTRPSPGLRASIDLTDGTVLVVTQLTWRGETIEATVFGSQRIQFSQRRVRRVELSGGKRIRLGALDPADFKARPYFGRSWPYRVDKNVLGGPLTVGGAGYRHGIGLHAACTIQWDLGRAYGRFMAQVGIDDSAGDLADADVRVIVDGKTVARFERLRAGEPPRTIDVSLSGASTLAIDVGYGLRGDVQDRVNLVNAVLIRP